MIEKKSRSYRAASRTFETRSRSHLGDSPVFGSWRQDVDANDERSRDEGESSGSESETEEVPEVQENGGLREWAPKLYAWLAPRGAKQRTWEFAGHEVNYLSIEVMASVVSLIIALCISVFMEGKWGLVRIFSLRALCRWSFVGLLYSLKTVLLTVTVESGLHNVIYRMMDNLYVIVAAVVSFFVFNRLYGKLEWLSLSMLIFSAPAFFIMRERCHLNFCNIFTFQHREENFAGMLAAICAISLGAVASVLAERIFKNRYRGRLAGRDDGTMHGRYYIHRVHLDLVCSVLGVAVWIAQYLLNDGEWGSRTDVMFGEWSRIHVVLLSLTVGQMWWAGLVVKNFSTVTKSLIQTVFGVLSVCIVDPIVGITLGRNWSIRSIPSILIAIFVVICAVLFQTGRLNVKFLWKNAGLTPKREYGGLQACKQMFCKRAPEPEDTADSPPEACAFLKYSLPFFYVISNALQTEFQNDVSANRYFVPQSLQVGIPFCGMCLACVLTVSTYGFAGLREALNPCSLPKFFALGFLQSASGALSGLAMAIGINASLKEAMGKIYTPLAMVLGRLILKHSYAWIEWLSHTASFDAAVILAFMDATVANHRPGRSSHVSAIFCVAASASVSCINSVIMELALQNTTTPFIINKVRLDLGAFCWSITFLPVMGFLGVHGGRPDLAYWVYRPNPYWACEKLGSCDAATGAFISSNTTASGELECVCGRGVFLGWDSWFIYATLAAGVVYSWLTGKVVQNFNTVIRSVFDMFPIVLLWFVISPLASRVPLEAFQSYYYHGPIPFVNPDRAKDLMTIVNPLCGLTYIVAAGQVREVAEFRKGVRKEEESYESSDESTSDISQSEGVC
ncbi:Pol [Symbiodinium sp. CCMP2592]|nr:Pol [Symbiodinium sp. CCMP2592]